MTIQDRIERTVELPVSQERLWRALTQAEELSKWFGKCTRVDLRIGGLIEWDWNDPDQSVIEILEPIHHFAYRWRPGAYDPTQSLSAHTTLVEFFLESTPTGSRLRLVESGFAGLPVAMRARAFVDNDGGWTEELADLVNYLGSE